MYSNESEWQVDFFHYTNVESLCAVTELWVTN